DVIPHIRNIVINKSLDVEHHHADLHLSLIVAEEEDPVQPVPTVEADHLVVKGATLVKPLRKDVRLDPLHGHADSLGRHHRGHSWSLTYSRAPSLRTNQRVRATPRARGLRARSFLCRALTRTAG